MRSKHFNIVAIAVWMVGWLVIFFAAIAPIVSQILLLQILNSIRGDIYKMGLFARDYVRVTLKFTIICI